MRASEWTEFVTQDRPGRIDRLCFGNPEEVNDQRRGDSLRQVYRFRPGQRFGVVWWRRYSDRSQKRTLMIAEATGACTTPKIWLPGFEGAVTIHLMLEQLGPAGQDGVVDHFLDLIGLLRCNRIDPTRVIPTYYRELAYRIMAGQISRWRRFDRYLLEFPACVM